MIELSHHAIAKWIKIRSPKKTLTWEQACLELRSLLDKAKFRKILEKKKDDDVITALYTTGRSGCKIRFLVAIQSIPYKLVTIL